LYVERTRSQSSWSYEPRFVCIGRKPRRYSSTTLVSVVVRIGNEVHRLERGDKFFTVKTAKDAAVCYATTGVGNAKVTTLDD
jgi:hypothetical protein